jgi:mannose-1-phosphate guanylyltransferase
MLRQTSTPPASVPQPAICKAAKTDATNMPRMRSQAIAGQLARDAKQGPRKVDEFGVRKKNAMTSAVVLCAGMGTRLRPLSDELAKPLMPVGDRPAFAHAIDMLRAAGIASIGINTHHRPTDFLQYIEYLGGYLHVEHEDKIRGTAGGVAKVAATLAEGDVVVWNGDVVVPALGVAELVARRRSEASIMLWVIEPLRAGEGTVGLDARGNVVRLRGERFGVETSGGNYVGVMAMAPGVRASLPQQGCLVADVALPLLRQGKSIGAFLYDGPWDDIGSPAGLLRSNLRWLERRQPTAWYAADATIEPTVELEQSVISRGARVTGAGTVRHCVVLPGASLEAPAERVIVGRKARMAAD